MDSRKRNGKPTIWREIYRNSCFTMKTENFNGEKSTSPLLKLQLYPFRVL
jgi:hypothetical protein